MINAKILLQSIQPGMSKSRILAIVQKAIDDLVLLDAQQVAASVGVTYSRVKQMGYQENIGEKMTGHGRYGKRIYFPSDVEKIRSLLRPAGHNPETSKKIAKMRAMRDKGATLMEIAGEFSHSEGYVGRLLRVQPSKGPRPDQRS